MISSFCTVSTDGTEYKILFVKKDLQHVLTGKCVMGVHFSASADRYLHIKDIGQKCFHFLLEFKAGFYYPRNLSLAGLSYFFGYFISSYNSMIDGYNHYTSIQCVNGK